MRSMGMLTELMGVGSDDGSWWLHGLKPRRCELCGALFMPKGRSQRFCCEGCRESRCRTCRFAAESGKRGAFCMVFNERLINGGLIKRCSAYVERPRKESE